MIMKGHRIETLLKASGKYCLKVDDVLSDIERMRDLSDQYGAPLYPNFIGRKGWKLEDYTEEFAISCLKLSEEM